MTCYICSNDKFITRSGVVRDNQNLSVLECTNCGLVTLSSIDHITEGHYQDSKMHGEKPLPITDWLNETKADDDRRFEMLKQKIVNSRVLDFGCGCGGFLLNAKQLTKHVEGVELEDRLQPWFEDNKIKVWTSLSELKKDESKKYDLITSFHVFEHLADPRQMLKDIAELLNNEGEFIIEVPSANDALLTLYNSEPFSRFTYWSQHLFLFTSHTLSELVKQSGLKLQWQKQVQRYSLSNHLYWLSKGLPSGHHKWAFLNDPLLNELYAAQLAAIDKTDTLMAGIVKK